MKSSIDPIVTVPEARSISGSATVAQVVALNEFSTQHRADAEKVLSDTNPLFGIKTELQVCVGSASMTVGELLGAREHQVLVLDRTPEQPVDLLLDGKVIARGQLVAVDGNFAVRITELPTPLALRS